MRQMHLWLALLLALALGIYGCSSCNGDDDDDDGSPADDDSDDDSDDDTADDDTADDDTADDDTEDDDVDDDDQPPYDTALCAPFMEAFYVTCHFQLELEGTIVDQEAATASCEEVEYLAWPCLVDCYLDYGNACIALYDCTMECTEE